jgi:hypothetical protein
MGVSPSRKGPLFWGMGVRSSPWQIFLRLGAPGEQVGDSHRLPTTAASSRNFPGIERVCYGPQ